MPLATSGMSSWKLGDGRASSKLLLSIYLLLGVNFSTGGWCLAVSRKQALRRSLAVRGMFTRDSSRSQRLWERKEGNVIEWREKLACSSLSVKAVAKPTGGAGAGRFWRLLCQLVPGREPGEAA